MVNFDTAFEATLQHEGGYAFVQGDNGGETYKGISRKFHPNWYGWYLVDQYKAFYLKEFNTDLPLNYNIKSVDMDKAVRDFYCNEFWEPLQCHCLTNRPIACELFDTGVNMGKRTAVLILQQAVNLHNAHNNNHQMLKEDGVIGPITLRCVETLPYVCATIMLKIMNGLQFMRYVNIVKYDESQIKFFRGWMKRV